MKRFLKRCLIGFVTLGLCIGLTACGQNGDTTTTTAATDGVTITGDATTTVPTTTVPTTTVQRPGETYSANGQTKDGYTRGTTLSTDYRADDDLSATTIGNTTTTAPTTATQQPIETYPVREQAKDGYTLKVISYNIQTHRGTALATAYRAQMLKTFIDELQPDSIGLQEVTTEWHPELDGVAFNSSYVGVGYTTNEKAEACSIYYRTDKFELVNSGTFWLSDTPEVRDSMFEGASEPRVCTWVHLKEKKTGLEYVHINTHLAHDSYRMRQKQLAVIVDRLQQFGDLPIVFTGDFNQSTIGGSMPSPFADARATAAQTVSKDQWASVVRYQDPATTTYNPARAPLDFIFYTKEDFTATVYKNIHHHEDGLWMSDHLPQYGELQFK